MGNLCCGCCCDIEGKRGKYQPIPGRDDIEGEHTKKQNPQSLLPNQVLANVVPPPNLPSEFYLQYELGEQLGIGTTSRVYAVQVKWHGHSHSGSTQKKNTPHTFPLACKIIDKRKLTFKMNRNDSEALLQQLRKEVDILRRLSHPHIVTYVDFLESREFIIIITERLMGGELFDYIASQGALPEEICRMYMYGVCSALVYMHDRGVVHRDIKPENLIFCADKTGKKVLKLIDFGFSTVLKHELTGSFLGTGGYLAPEIRQQRPYSFSADMWALGVTLFSTLSATLPHPPSSSPLPAVLDKTRWRVKFRGKAWEQVGDEGKALVKGLLCPDPLRRLTAREVVEHPWFRSYHSQSAASISSSFRVGVKVTRNVRGHPITSGKSESAGRSRGTSHPHPLIQSLPLSLPLPTIVSPLVTPRSEEAGGGMSSRSEVSSAEGNGYNGGEKPMESARSETGGEILKREGGFDYLPSSSYVDRGYLKDGLVAVAGSASSSSGLAGREKIAMLGEIGRMTSKNKSNSQSEVEIDDVVYVHNPYWELSTITPTLRRSYSLCSLEQSKVNLLQGTVARKARESRCSSSESVLGVGGGDGSMTTREGGSEGGSEEGVRMNKGGGSAGNSEIWDISASGNGRLRGNSFFFDEMHDTLAGDLFFSTYIPPTSSKSNK